MVTLICQLRATDMWMPTSYCKLPFQTIHWPSLVTFTHVHNIMSCDPKSLYMLIWHFLHEQKSLFYKMHTLAWPSVKKICWPCYDFIIQKTLYCHSTLHCTLTLLGSESYITFKWPWNSNSIHKVCNHNSLPLPGQRCHWSDDLLFTVNHAKLKVISVKPALKALSSEPNMASLPLTQKVYASHKLAKWWQLTPYDLLYGTKARLSKSQSW